MTSTLEKPSQTHRIALGISYQGTAYHGWQTQPSGGSVQDALEAAIFQFTQYPLNTVCAGRTDTGVHALEQVIHLDSPVTRSEASWVRGLNSLLPPDISVKWASPVNVDFHARFSAVSRSYIYVLRNHRVRSALWHGKVGWDFHSLNLEAMQEASQYLVGTHDFSSFRSSQCQAHSPIRCLNYLDIKKEGDLFFFILNANAFLHHMVRNIVGALLYVGQGKQQAVMLKSLLEAKNRTLAAPTFMPDGLYLAHIEYPLSCGLTQIKAFNPDEAISAWLQA